MRERIYSITIYNGKKLYLEGKYTENVSSPKDRLRLINKNEDRLLDTIFDGNFSTSRIMEFLKTRVGPDARSDDLAVLRELMRTGGKMYDDDIRIVIGYDGV